MSGDRERQNGTENGFEEWGGYMAAKRAKLNVQFNESSESGCISKIFAGVTVHINGHVNPTNLRNIFVQHGGSYDSFATSTTDFVVALNLSEATKRKWGSKTVRPEWITQSISAGTKLDHRNYLLYNFNEENNQKTLMQTFYPRTEGHQQSGATSMGSPGNKNNLQSKNDRGATSAIKGKRLMAWEDGFLEEFWDHSRLHYISTMKRALQLHVAKLRRSSSNHKFVEYERYEKEVQEENSCSMELRNSDHDVLFLVDLDCFFVAAGRLTRPHMVGLPVVVTHFGGNRNVSSNSDIACASYEARKYGIRNGMWVSQAKELCPDLEVIPYDFEVYQKISMDFCNVVTGLTLNIEPGSCDELLVDVTSILNRIPGSTPLSLAAFLRKRIFEVTKCKASIGIGRNRLLAKLASKKAKPDGVFMIDGSNINDYLKVQPLRDLTGIGHSIMEKISDELPDVKTCGDLQQIKLEELQARFGVKKGETLFNACRGVDDQKLNFDFERPKSISIDVNYGIRLTEKWQFDKLLMNIAKALSKRAQEAEACGTKLQVTVLTQRKDAPEPLKPGGHGWCDVNNKTGTLLNPTRNNLVIYKSMLSLLSNFTVPVEKYRGVGVSLTGLKFDFDGKKEVQSTLFASLAKQSSRSEALRNLTTAEEIGVNTEDFPSTSELLLEDKTKVDLNVLPLLPEDIQQEVVEFYGLNGLRSSPLKQCPAAEPVPSTSRVAQLSMQMNRQHFGDSNKLVEQESDVVTELSTSFMDALPEDIREELRSDFNQMEAITHPVPEINVIEAPAATESYKGVENGSEPDTFASREPFENKQKGETEEECLRVVSLLPEENPACVPFSRINWWNYNGKDKLPTEFDIDGFATVTSSKVPPSVAIPTLNDKTEVADIRSIIRQGVDNLPNPRRSDLSGLITYFEELISGNFFKQTQLLLKFLNRLSEDRTVNTKWSKIFRLIIRICQNKMQRLFGVPLQLHNIEDDDEDESDDKLKPTETILF